MRLIFIPALTLLLMFLSLPAMAQEAGDELVVAVKPKATMRSEPNVQGKIVDTIPGGTKVKVIALSGHTDAVMNVSAKWIQVSYKGKTGWIFAPLLKRVSDRHTVRILNGTIILDDPGAVPGADLAQLTAGAAKSDVELEITTQPPDAMRQCSGNLVLRRGGRLQNGKNVFNCGGVSAESTYRVSDWQIISGRLYFTAEKTWTEVCHSDNCQDVSRKEKTTQEFRNVKSVSAGKFIAEF